jgi:hypothetical protein
LAGSAALCWGAAFVSPLALVALADGPDLGDTLSWAALLTSLFAATALALAGTVLGALGVQRRHGRQEALRGLCLNSFLLGGSVLAWGLVAFAAFLAAALASLD